MVKVEKNACKTHTFEVTVDHVRQMTLPTFADYDDLSVDLCMCCESGTLVRNTTALLPHFIMVYLSNDMYIVYIVQCSMDLHLDKICLFFNELIYGERAALRC